MIEALLNKIPMIRVLYLSIYSFHMPAFIIIAGMLSKSEFNFARLVKLMQSIVVPFVAFTLLYELFNFLSKGEISSYTRNMQPYWILWFLFSLAIWRLCLPILLKCKCSMVIAFIVSIIAGYFEEIGYFLGVSRTLYFLPFFLIGYKLKPNVLYKIKDKFAYNLSLVVPVAIIVLNLFFFSVYQDIQYQWLWGSYSYPRLGNDSLICAPLIRIMLYTISLFTSFSVLLLIPSNEIYASSGGKNTLFVFVWHGFFIKIFAEVGLISIIGGFVPVLSIVVMFSISAILTVLLSNSFVANLSKNYILQPMEAIMLLKANKANSIP